MAHAARPAQHTPISFLTALSLPASLPDSTSIILQAQRTMGNIGPRHGCTWLHQLLQITCKVKARAVFTERRAFKTSPPWALKPCNVSAYPCLNSTLEDPCSLSNTLREWHTHLGSSMCFCRAAGMRDPCPRHPGAQQRHEQYSLNS